MIDFIRAHGCSIERMGPCRWDARPSRVASAWHRGLESSLLWTSLTTCSCSQRVPPYRSSTGAGWRAAFLPGRVTTSAAARRWHREDHDPRGGTSSCRYRCRSLRWLSETWRAPRGRRRALTQRASGDREILGADNCSATPNNGMGATLSHGPRWKSTVNLPSAHTRR
jgi:hypothetical protein